MFANADAVLSFIGKNDVQFVDVRFCDLPGVMQHFTFPASNFGESVFTEGLMFDGSSIRGFQQIHESDMLLLPDPSTAYMDPFRQHPTLIMNFFIHDPLTGEAYSRDPRNIAKKAEDYLRGSGIADTSYFGPEAEFYIFDDIRFGTLLKTADNLMNFKYVVKNVARRNGRTVTFMPKPIFQDNGSGMHCHQSLWKDGAPLFYDEIGYAGLSDLARYYIGGLLKHAPSLLAFTNPTTNSYRRLVPGYEAPVNLVYSQRNRSACCRIPITGSNPKAKRLEFRVPDPSCNPYLAFAAMLMAGLDGIRNKIEPPEPVDKDLYELPPDELAAVPQVPGSLEAVLDRLETDHEYLLEGGVFTPDVIDTWIDYKRVNEVDAIRLRPHPYEFALYYDI